MAKKATSTKEEKEEIFMDAVIEEKSVEDNAKEDIGRLSPEWNDYVMSLFTEEELGDVDSGKPKPLVSGLRRVARMLLGKTTFSGPTQVFPATDESGPGRATVVYTVIFENGETYVEVADCWHGNTDDVVLVYPVASASTRAESRALRKALGLRTVAFEEITSKRLLSIH